MVSFILTGAEVPREIGLIPPYRGNLTTSSLHIISQTAAAAAAAAAMLNFVPQEFSDDTECMNG